MKVEFDEDSQILGSANASRSEFNSPSSSAMTRKLMKMGIVKSERQASLLLVGVIIFCIVASLLILFRGMIFKGKPTYREDIPESVLKTLPPDVVSKIPSRN